MNLNRKRFTTLNKPGSKMTYSTVLNLWGKEKELTPVYFKLPDD